MNATHAVKAKERSWLGKLLVDLDAPVIILGNLALLALVAACYRMGLGLGDATGLTDAIPWGIWIGFDFSLIAFSAAAFTMAGLVYVLRREEYRPALRPSVLTGLLGYTAVLAILILDLGRPDRFYHFLIFWNMHSPLFEISWCVLLYSLVLTIEVSPQVFDRLGMGKAARLVHRIIIPVAIAAVTLSSLHQSTLGTLYLNMPYRLHFLWYTPILPVLFFVSSVMTGLCMAIVSYVVATRVIGQREKPRIVRGLACGAGWVAALYLALKVGDILLAGEWPGLLAFDALSLRMWLELALAAVPMVLFLVPSLRARPQALGCGVALMLAGTLLNRFNATLFAQTAPSGATYSPSLVEWVTTIGVISAAMLAWLIGARFLAIFEQVRGTHHS